MPEIVLFDLDGTLVDTAPDLVLALNLLRERQGLAHLEYASMRAWASHGSMAILQAGFGINPKDQGFTALQTEYLGLYEQIMTQHAQLFEGTLSLLEVMHNKGIVWGVVTNKPKRFTLPILQALVMPYPPSCVICADDVSTPKPSPEGLLKALSLTHRSAAQAIYVGDAERDIQAGKAAGIKTVLAKYGYLSDAEQAEHWQPDFEIQHMTDLIALL